MKNTRNVSCRRYVDMDVNTCGFQGAYNIRSRSLQF